MDFTQILTAYGPALALLVMAVSWAARQLFPILVKENADSRSERVARELAEREDRKHSQDEIIDLVRSTATVIALNNAALGQMTTAVGQLTETLHDITTVVARHGAAIERIENQLGAAK